LASPTTSPRSDTPWPLFRSLRVFQAANIVVGLTLAAIAIPEQMATAPLGGIPSSARQA
jgi:sulfate permease, SulP family